ncbi:MAG: exo-alpha-sialidase [Planctomycetota bacterium]|nr:exo-alpha-sialidase [Planctomycetota bacterium]
MTNPTTLNAENEDAVLNIGSRRELFVDTYLIERLQGARLVLQKPQPGGVAVKYDGPMDGVFSFFTTVLKDGDKYLMYYRGHPWGPDWTKSVTCYAESDDGIHWRKPELGIVEVNGSKKNNAILPVGRAFTAFIDGRPGVPDGERFKGNIEGKDGLKGYVSPDGVHWKLVQEKAIVTPSLPNHFDSQNVMFWSEAEECYCLYARYMEGGKRTTARATSKDFLTWSAPTKLVYGDTGNTTPSQHLYTNQTHPYIRAPHIYISLPGRFQAGRRVLNAAQAEAVGVHGGGGKAGDIADGVFLTSRAGSTRYDFTFRESFVRPGIGDSNWTSRNNYPALGVVQTGPNEMSMYVQRNYGQTSGYLERLTLRLDGFVSLNAPYAGGEMITKPLKFTGKEMAINYSTSAAGGIRIEIQSADGKPLPGFALEDCTEIIGDHIERVVAWKGTTDVSKLAGETVRLRFVMKDADLFAIKFQ